jgi:mRNA interferase RelE/StbE
MKMSYNLLFHEDAAKDLKNLDGRERIAVLKQLKKIKENPELGDDLGNKAGINLTGYKKIYVDNKRIRIVYKVISEKVLVYVISIGKKENMEVYRQSIKRI